jgi:hypothetical protein
MVVQFQKDPFNAAKLGVQYQGRCHVNRASAFAA